MTKKTQLARQKISFRSEGDLVHTKVPDLQTLHDLFGTSDTTLSTELMKQAVKAAGPYREGIYELVLAIIEDFAPNDAVERLIAVQMAATHTSMMEVSAKMNGVKTIQAHEVYERSFNRLARTFTAQIEALRKHRNGGQSKVTVEHVTVNEGGQAIVGNVVGRGGPRNR